MTVLKSFFSLTRNYLVTLPAQLNFPSTQKVCLDLSPGYYDVKVTITLETKDKTQKLLEHHGLRKRHLHCMSFLVSADLASTLMPYFPSPLPNTHYKLILITLSVTLLLSFTFYLLT